MDRIVVGLDGSPESAKALPLAAELARGLRERLLLSYAMPAAAVSGLEVPAALAAEWSRIIRDHGATVLEDAAEGANLDGLQVEQRLLHGPPASALRHEGRREHTDLIVVGHRQRDAVERAFSSSVAEQLAQTCNRPVLIVRGTVQPLRSAAIAVGIDGSPESQAAAQYAARAAAASGAHVLLVHVRPPGEHLEIGDAMSEHVARIARELENFAGGPVSERIEQGDPAEALARVAGEVGIALLVVGHRGRGKLARTLLGSVADRLIELSPKPVLIVR